MPLENLCRLIAKQGFYEAKKLNSSELPIRTVGDFCLLLGAVIVADRYELPVDKILAAKYSFDIPSSEQNLQTLGEKSEVVVNCCGGGQVK